MNLLTPIMTSVSTVVIILKVISMVESARVTGAGFPVIEGVKSMRGSKR